MKQEVGQPLDGFLCIEQIRNVVPKRFCPVDINRDIIFLICIFHLVVGPWSAWEKKSPRKLKPPETMIQWTR